MGDSYETFKNMSKMPFSLEIALRRRYSVL